MAKSRRRIVCTFVNWCKRLFGTKSLDSINVGVKKDANVDEIMMTIERILRAQHDIGLVKITILILMITVNSVILENKQLVFLLH